MLDVFELAGRETGYWANYFLRSVRIEGGLATARKLLWKSGYIPSCDGGWASCTVANGRVFVYFTGKVAKDPAKGIRPITADLLADLGWREDAPADLVAKIEEARKSEKYKKTQRKKAEMEACGAEFMAGLDPKVAEKYADFIKKRFAPMIADEYGWNNLTWDNLTQLVKLKDKEFTEQRQFELAAGGCGNCREIGLAGFERVANWTDTIVCLDAGAGQELWRKSFEHAGRPKLGDYSDTCGGAATPAVVDHRCYVLGLFGTYCLSAKGGEVIWQNKAGAVAASPLVLNDVVCCGSPLSAYNAATGRLLWTQPKVFGQGSPVPWAHQGRTRVIFSGGALGTCCLDPATGKVLWNVADYSWATPVVAGDYLLIGAGKKAVYKREYAG